MTTPRPHDQPTAPGTTTETQTANWTRRYLANWRAEQDRPGADRGTAARDNRARSTMAAAFVGTIDYLDLSGCSDAEFADAARAFVTAWNHADALEEAPPTDADQPSSASEPATNHTSDQDDAENRTATVVQVDTSTGGVCRHRPVASGSYSNPTILDDGRQRLTCSGPCLDCGQTVHRIEYRTLPPTPPPDGRSG